MRFKCRAEKYKQKLRAIFHSYGERLKVKFITIENIEFHLVSISIIIILCPAFRSKVLIEGVRSFFATARHLPSRCPIWPVFSIACVTTRWRQCAAHEIPKIMSVYFVLAPSNGCSYLIQNVFIVIFIDNIWINISFTVEQIIIVLLLLSWYRWSSKDTAFIIFLPLLDVTEKICSIRISYNMNFSMKNVWQKFTTMLHKNERLIHDSSKTKIKKVIHEKRKIVIWTFI